MLVAAWTPDDALPQAVVGVGVGVGVDGAGADVDVDVEDDGDAEQGLQNGHADELDDAGKSRKWKLSRR